MSERECSICHKREEWSSLPHKWAWWGSILMQEDGLPLLFTCSDLCRRAVDILGGPEATLAMIWKIRGTTVRYNRSKYKDILKAQMRIVL